MEMPVPLMPFLTMLIAVIAAAGVTIWLLTLGGPAVFAAALPASLIAALGLRKLYK